MPTLVGGEGLGLFNSSQLAGFGRPQVGGGTDRVYVNTVTGNLVVHAQDEFVSATGLDLTLLRTYNSLGRFLDDNGDNWQVALTRRLVIGGGQNPIARISGDGHEALFSFNASLGYWRSTAGEGAHDLIRAAGANWEYVAGGTGVTETYDSSGRLTSVRDVDGNTLTYSYTGSLLTRVQDASGQLTHLDYAGNNLTQIRVVGLVPGATSSTQKQTLIRVRYAYDGMNRLTQVRIDLSLGTDNSTSDGKIYVTTYTYDGASKRIASISQSDGSQLRVTYAQVGDEFRVESLTTVVGANQPERVLSFNYDLAASRTDVRDALGHVSRQYYDNSKRLVRVESPSVEGARAAVVYSYDADGNLASVTDAVGRTTTYAYDSRGNLVEIRDAGGNTVRRTFNGNDQLVTETAYLTPDSDGAGPGQPSRPLTTRYIYDAEQHLRFAMSPEGRVTEHRYDTPGNRVATIVYTADYYNTTGLSETQSPPVTTLESWVSARDKTKTSRVDYTPDLTGQVKATTRYTAVDSAGNGVNNGEQSTTLSLHSLSGQLLQTTDPRGYSSVYTYDGMGRMLTARDAANRTTATVYDDAANTIRLTAAHGLVTTSVYNKAGELVSQTNTAGNGSALGTTTYFYDGAGQVRMVVDPTGAKSHSLYDAHGWKIADISAEGRLTEYVHNPAGQLIRTLRYDVTIGESQLVNGDGTPKVVTLYELRGGAPAANNRAPIVDLDSDNSNSSGTGYQTSAVSRQTVAAVDADLAVSDGGDSGGRLQGATALIVNLKDGPDEVLSVNTAGTSIQSSFSNGLLTLTGDDTVANYQAVLRTLTYRNGKAAGISLGVRTIDLAVRDGADSSWIARSRVALTNTAPTASNDSYVTVEDSVLNVAGPGVLANDSDVESALTAVLVSGPAKGTVTLNANGSFAYTPNANATGSDSFTYRASDGSLSSNTATVTINITPVNDAPVARNDSYSATEDTTLLVPAGVGLLANDSDVESSVLSLVILTQPAKGSLTANADGSFTYIPHANVNGTDSFTYRISDGSLNSNTATVTINIAPVNDAPVALNDSYTTAEDTILNVSGPGVLANDTDIDGSLAAVLVSGPTMGMLTLNRDGSFTYVPHANANGTDSFTYRATDDGLSSTATVTIHVGPLNDAPVAASDGYTTSEDAAVTVGAALGVLGNDTDADGDSLSAVVVSGPTKGTLAFNANGAFTYTPNANVNGTDSFTYRASDGSLASNTATVTINVTPVNDAPVAQNDSYTIMEDVVLNVAGPGVLANDSDVESALTAALFNGPTKGTLTLNANGAFTYTPNANATGSDTFSYRASDGSLNSNIATVTINITPVNDAPVALNDSYTVTEDAALIVAGPGVLANDSDVEGPLAAALVSGPSKGTVNFNADGSFTYTPHANTNGVDTFTYRATDGVAGTNAAVTINVTPVNDAPVLDLNEAGAGNGHTAHFPLTGSSVVIAPSTTIVDVDDTHLEQAQAAFTSAALANESLAVTIAAGVPITQSYANGVLTLTGHATVDQYRDVLRTLTYRNVLGTTMSSDRYVNVTVYDGSATSNVAVATIKKPAMEGETTRPPLTNLIRESVAAQYEMSMSSPSGMTFVRPAGDDAGLATSASAPGHAARVIDNLYDAAGRLTLVVDESGYATKFEYDGAGRKIAEVRYFSPITVPSSGRAEDVALSPDPLNDRRTRLIYDPDGLLRGTLDAAGYLVENIYDSAGRLARTVAYAEVTNEAYRLAGTLDQLRPSANAQDQVAYCFHDGQGRKTAYINEKGFLIASEYDSAGNKLREVRYERPVSYTGQDLQTLKAQATGLGDQVESWQYDNLSRVLRHTDHHGTVTQYDYDSLSGFLVKTTRALGQTDAFGRDDQRITTTRYDDLGRATQILGGEGSAALASSGESAWTQYATKHEYDLAGRRIRSTDPNGKTTIYFYDRESRLRYIVNGAGEVGETRYNPFGEVEALIQHSATLTPAALTGGIVPGTGYISELLSDSGERVTSTSYTARGDVDVVTNPLGHTTDFAYNAFKEAISKTFDIGFAPGETYRTDRFVYDPRGLVTRTVEDWGGNNRTTEIVSQDGTSGYDAFGRVVSSRDANGIFRTTSYDNLGRTVTSIDPSGSVTTAYDAFGRTVALTDRLGNTTTFQFDDAADAVTVTTPENVVTTRTRNRHGEEIAIAVNNGGTWETTTFTYDRDGRLRSAADPNAAAHPGRFRTENQYDAGGRLVASLDKNGTRTNYTYDDANRVLTRVVDPDGLAIRTRYEYSAFGQAIRIIDARGIVTESVYDKGGRTVAVIVDVAGLNLATTYSHDARGSTVLLQEGRIGTKADGVWTFGAAPKTTQYVYDALGRRIQEIVDPAGVALRTSYSYDPNGNMVEKTDPRLNAWRTVYDASNRQVFTIDPEGGVTERLYDSEGHVTGTNRYSTPISLENLGGSPSDAAVRNRLSPSPDKDRHTRFVYDKDGRLVFTIEAAHDVSGVLTNTGLRYAFEAVYDSAGRVLRNIRYATPLPADTMLTVESVRARLVVDAANDQHTRYTYDRGGRLISSMDAAGAVEAYEYDDNGNRTALTNKRSDTWIYLYDAANRMVEVRAPLESLNEFNSSVTVQAYQTTLIAYDALGNVTDRIEGYRTTAPGAPFVELRRTTYSYDARGLQIRIEHPTVGTYDAAADAAAGYVGRNEQISSLRSQTWHDERALAVVNRDVAGVYSYKVYDNARRVRYEIDAERYVTFYAYDANGNVTMVRRYATAINEAQVDGSGASLLDRETAVAAAAIDSADARNKALTAAAWVEQLVAQLATGESREISTTYDAANRKTEVRQPLVNYYLPGSSARGTAQPTTRYTYNAFGELIGEHSLRNPASSQWIDTYFGYDQAGRQTNRVDGLGYYTESQYDAFGRLTQRYEYAEKLASLPAAPPEFALLQRPSARSASAAGPDGNAAAGYDRVTRYAYDQMDRLTQEVLVGVQYARHGVGGAVEWVVSDVTNKSMSYDVLGNVIAVSDSSGATTRTYYDKLGRATAVIQPARIAPSADGGASLRAIDLDYSSELVWREYEPGYEMSHYSASVDWTSLASWGEGQVRVRLTWSDGVTQEKLLAAGAVATAFSRFKTGINTHLSIGSITVDKQLATSQWVTAYQTTNGAPRFELLGASTAAAAKLRYGVAGTPSANLSELALTKVGPAWVVAIPSAQAMPEGNYTYEFVADGAVVHSGTFSLSRAASEEPTVQGDGGSFELSPVTVMRYDALGNQVTQTRYIHGALDVKNDTFSMPVAAGQDQTSLLRYDRLGRVIESIDAAGKSQFTSVDAFGRARKVWRNQTDILGATREKVSLYEYDRSGRQIATIEIVRDPVVAGARVEKTQVQLNGFGEQVAKGIDTVGSVEANAAMPEVAFYDANGRMWKTNAGGVTKLFEYDLQGNVTSEAVVPDSTVITGPGAISGLTGAVRTEFVRDAAGRITEKREPQYAVEARSASGYTAAQLQTRTATASVHTSRQIIRPPSGEPYTLLTHTVAIAWPNIAGYGLQNQMRITVDYTGSWGTPGSKTFVVNADEAGATVSWTTREEGIGSITRVRAERWDGSAYVLIRDSAEVSTVEILTPRIVGTLFDGTFRYWGADNVARTANASAAGANAYTFSVSGIADGTYTYEFKTSLLGTEFVAGAAIDETYTGQFTVSGGRLTAVSAPLAGTQAAPVLQQVVDRWGNTIASTDPRNGGWVTHYRYDYASRVIWTQQPQVVAYGENTQASSISPIKRHYFDIRGNAIAVQDALGHTQRRFYDAAGQLVEEWNAASNGFVRHVYDALGRETRRMLANGRVVDMGYDRLDRLVWQETQGYESRRYDFYVYDEIGNRIGEKRGVAGAANDQGTGSGGEYTRYHYDTKGRLIQRITPLADAAAAVDALKTTYAYDAQGRKRSERDGLGRSQTWTYDYFRLQSYVDLGGATTSYSYDGYGRLIAASNTAVSQEVVNGGYSTSTHGQSLEYGYYENGRVKYIRDLKRGLRTHYEYDLAGNRIVERLVVESTKSLHQDTRLTYDALGRLVRAADARYRIDYGYDAVGNRRVIRSEYLAGTAAGYNGTYGRNTGSTITVTINNHGLSTGDTVRLEFRTGSGTDNDYTITVIDANRFWLTDTATGITSGSVALVGRVRDYWYKYDADNRIVLAQGYRFGNGTGIGGGTQLQYDGAGNRTVAIGLEGSTTVTRKHTYDPAGLISQSTYQTSTIAERPTTNRVYDTQGRIVQYIEYGANGGETAKRRTVTYDANGRITKQEYWTQGTGGAWTNTVDVDYQDANGLWYDAAGNLLKYQVKGVTGTLYTQTYVYQYVRFAGQYREKQISGSGQADQGGFTPGTTITSYDVNGYVTSVSQTGQAFRTFVNDQQGQILKKIQSNHVVAYGYANGMPLGNVSTDAAVKPDFDYNYNPVSASYPPQSPGQYISQAGDTVQKIAYAVYGDASLWYLIADANGLSGSETLAAGRTLNIPNRVSNLHNTSQTFRPYNPAEIIGDTTPDVSYVPPPPPSNKCQQTAQIIGAVVAIIVTAILSEYMPTELAAATGAVVGNTVSQMVYLSANDQYDWEKAGLYSPLGANIASEKASDGRYSTNSAVVTGLVAFQAGAAGSYVGAYVADVWGPLAGSIAGGVAGAVTGNVTAQGLNIALGRQESFSWRAVAASAAGGVVSGVAGYATNGARNGEWDAVTARATSVIGNVGAQYAQILINKNGKIDWVSVAVDAFGNAIGNSIVGAMKSGTQAPDHVKSLGPEAEQAWQRTVAQGGSEADAFDAATLASGEASSIQTYALGDPNAPRAEQLTVETTYADGGDGYYHPAIAATPGSAQGGLYNASVGPVSEGFFESLADGFGRRFNDDLSIFQFSPFGGDPLISGSDLINAGRGVLSFVTDGLTDAIPGTEFFGFGQAAAARNEARGQALRDSISGYFDALSFGYQSLLAGDTASAGSIFGGALYGPTRELGLAFATGGMSRAGLFSLEAAKPVSDFGVAFFGKDNLLKYYVGDDVMLGGPNRSFFFMPIEDAGDVYNSASAAIRSGMAPSARNAWLNGQDTYGISFPLNNLETRLPTAADAGGYEHFFPGGNTAVHVPDTDWFLVNQTREVVTPGGRPMPAGSVLFRVGDSGEWIPLWGY